jgi:hypothetical protein
MSWLVSAGGAPVRVASDDDAARLVGALVKRLAPRHIHAAADTARAIENGGGVITNGEWTITITGDG